MKEDHKRAKIFAETIYNCSKLEIDLDSVESNIVIFDAKEGTAIEAIELFENQGIRMVPFGPKTIRATFHFQISEAQFSRLIETTTSLFS